MKRNITCLLFIFFSLVYFNLNAQELRVIDNKGTRKNINKISKNNTGIKPTTNVYSGDVYIDELNGEVFIYDGKNNTWEPFTQYWSLKGNASTNPSTDFLGTTDNNDLVLKTNNIERIRFGHITFPNNGEVLINRATPNSFPRSFPLIIKANGTSIFGFEDSESNDFWDWNLFKQGHLSLQLRGNSNPRIVLLKNPWNGVGIGGNPASYVNFHVHGNVRIDNLANVSSFDKFVVAEADGDLRSINSSDVYSTVTQTVTSGNEIATHSSGGTTTVTSIYETVTTLNNTISGHKIADYTNEDGSNISINETVTTLSQSASNTNTQVTANTANTIATYTNENGSNTTINETVTSLSFRTVTGDTTTANTYFIDYLDEKGATNNIDVSGLTYKGTPGSVFFAGSDGTIDEDNDQFFWNNTDNRLHIGNPLTGNNKLTVNGQARAWNFNAGNGTFRNPAFRFANDLDTGMFRPSANNLAFSTNESEALRIDASQNVGIGTTTPEKKLDVNGEAKIRTLNTGDVTTDNIIVAGTDGVLKNIPVTYIQSEVIITPTASGMASRTTATHSAGGTTTVTNIYETVTVLTDTNTATDKKTIAIYTNENGSIAEVKETITNIVQADSNTLTQVNNATPTANTIATYTKEDGDTVTINETVTKIEQYTPTTGSAPFSPSTPDPSRSSDSPGDIKYFNENNPTTTPTRVRVVSTDADNLIKIGNDGGAYLNAPLVKFAGKIDSNGSIMNGSKSSPSSFNFTSSRINDGDYQISFSDIGTSNYIIQLTVIDTAPSASLKSVPVITYYQQQTDGFRVKIENTASTDLSRQFMFVVYTF